MDFATSFVLDGSVSLAWGFEDEDDAYAASLLDRMPGLQALVPGIWPLEVANALLVGERRRRITPADATWFLAILETFPIGVDPDSTARVWRETIHLARAHGLSAYDASYLELAIRLGLPIATLDGKLKTAAVAVGVPLFQSP